MRLLDYIFIIGVAMLLKVIMVRLKDCVEIEQTFPKSFLGAGHEMNDFANGECGSAKMKEEAFTSHMCLMVEKPIQRLLLVRLLDTLYLQCVQGKANDYLLVRLLDTLHFGETTE